MGPLKMRVGAASEAAGIPESINTRVMLGLSWGYLGVILGLFWGYLGVILGLYWGYLRVILGLSWGYIGVICVQGLSRLSWSTSSSSRRTPSIVCDPLAFPYVLPLSQICPCVQDKQRQRVKSINQQQKPRGKHEPVRVRIRGPRASHSFRGGAAQGSLMYELRIELESGS